MKLRIKALQLRKEKKWGKHRIAKTLGLADWQVRDWIYYNRGTSLLWSFPNFDIWIQSRFIGNILYEKIISKTKTSFVFSTHQNIFQDEV